MNESSLETDINIDNQWCEVSSFSSTMQWWLQSIWVFTELCFVSNLLSQETLTVVTPIVSWELNIEKESMLRKYSSFIKHTKHLDFPYFFFFKYIFEGKWRDFPFFLFFIWKINACKGHSFKLKRVSSLFFIYYQ